MSEEIRIRCPLCGMMPYLTTGRGNLRATLAKAEAEIKVFLMEIGGREKGEWKTDKSGKYRRKPKGKIKYHDVTADNMQLLQELKPEILAQLEKIRTLMESIP